MEMLKIREVCDRLCVCRATVVRWIDSGRLPARNLAPGELRAMWRVTAQDLDKFIAQRNGA